MNEQILELAKQAGLKFPSETAMSPVELKFAELIIKETMQVVANTVAWNGYLNAAEAVIEHFKE